MAKKKKKVYPVITNKKVRRDYLIGEEYEAGIVLQGSEVKSIRNAEMSIQEAYVRVIKNEVWLIGAHIATYEKSYALNHDPYRKRKLLLRKSEIRKLALKTREVGVTIMPLTAYFNPCGLVKLKIVVCKGKKKYDKRGALQKDAIKKEIQTHIKENKYE